MNYKVYAESRYLGTINTSGKVTDVSEGVSGVNALQHLIALFPEGFSVIKDKPKRGVFRRWR